MLCLIKVTVTISQLPRQLTFYGWLVVNRIIICRTNFSRHIVYKDTNISRKYFWRFKVYDRHAQGLKNVLQSLIVKFQDESSKTLKIWHYTV